MTCLLITGGIGSGKTEVCRFFREKGVPVYDCDSSAKAIYDLYPGIVSRVEEALGTLLRTPEGGIDRKKLSLIVFSNPVALAKVESIVHPAVLEDFTLWKEANSDYPLVVIESAIAASKPLFSQAYDKVLLVTANPEIRIRRIVERDSSSKERARQRMAAQSFPEGIVPDFTIVNDGTLDELRDKAEGVLSALNTC